ncbi:MAG: hypothetical protein DRO67_07420 [Candidatus Asgardarchaeum californiense]|nr:MAG: hypothetical protein DRO67_07420 [Candidatus Asgardarchaeum californiense]
MTDKKKVQFFSFQVDLVNRVEKKEIVNLECKNCEKKYEMKNQRAIALIGDRFYQGAFLSAIELEKASSNWENTLHDINHKGTGVPQVNHGLPDITQFVGYNNNVKYNPETKEMSMDIHINDKTQYASAWRGYVELCEQAGQTPNVSVSFFALTKYVKAKDLPKGINYSAYGYGEEDMVLYIYNIRPRALSTVFQGACNDKDGCGIKQNQKQPEDNGEDEAIQAQKEEIIKWLKNHKEE